MITTRQGWITDAISVLNHIAKNTHVIVQAMEFLVHEKLIEYSGDFFELSTEEKVAIYEDIFQNCDRDSLIDDLVNLYIKERLDNKQIK